MGARQGRGLSQWERGRAERSANQRKVLPGAEPGRGCPVWCHTGSRVDKCLHMGAGARVLLVTRTGWDTHPLRIIASKCVQV